MFLRRTGRIFAPIVITLVLLAACEGGLRLWGFDVALSGAGDPRVNLLPLFHPAVRADGTEILKRRHVKQPVEIRREKPPGALRVFVIGGSSVAGYPFGPEFSLTRFLQERLESRFPDRIVNVVNCGVPGIGSWHAREIVGEIARYAPDVVVVYAGHNDWIFPGPESAGRLLRTLSRLRLYQLAVVARTALRSWWVGPIDTRQLRSDYEPYGRARDRARGRATLTASEREHIQTRYAENLRAIVARARAAGAEVILANLGQNMSDFPPGASRHRSDISQAERARWRSEVEHAAALERAGDCDAALDHLHAASDIDDHPALLHFARGRCLEALGRFEEARAAYATASDLDEVPLGVPGEFNALIREIAEETGAHFVDVAGALERNSAHGLVGDELFYDYVHPTIAGHYEIARAVGEAMGVPTDLDPGTDLAVLESRREVQQGTPAARILLFIALGWYDAAREEVDRASERFPKLRALDEVLERMRAEDPQRAYTDLPAGSGWSGAAVRLPDS